jgi:hypothetical protein
MSNGAEAREATLSAVQSDQHQLADQLRDLSNMVSRIEEQLMGGPMTQMAGAAAAQERATLGPGNVMPLQAGVDRPPMPGMLPQMCELGMNNSSAVRDIATRLQQVSRLLGIEGG